MAQRTQLSADQLSDFASRYGLGDYIDGEAIDAGTINSNYSVSTQKGRYFLRVNEGKSEDDVSWEAELVSRVAAASIPTPVPLEVDGRRYLRWNEKYISVFPWVQGTHRRRDWVSPRDVAGVSAALADLHRVDWSGMPEREGIYTLRHIDERLAGIDPAGDIELAENLSELRAELDYQRELAPLPGRGVIHQDLFRDNVLFDGKWIAALLDFEQACIGEFLYDLAVVINAWCFGDHGFMKGLVCAAIGAYQERAGVDLDIESALYPQCRRAAARFAVTRITDVYLVGDNDPEKDYRRYVRRLSAWRELGAAGLAEWCV
jgi:homoserine kinase type II